MKKCTLATGAVLVAALMGCSALPIKSEIKENHFRFENFEREGSLTQEYIHLLCFNQKPTGWTEPRQYKSGPQSLWVLASISERDIANSTKQAFYKFDITLESKKSYMLNRKRSGNNLSVWIQEADTGRRVSAVKTKELERDVMNDYFLRKKRCQASSV